MGSSCITDQGHKRDVPLKKQNNSQTITISKNELSLTHSPLNKNQRLHKLFYNKQENMVEQLQMNYYFDTETLKQVDNKCTFEIQSKINLNIWIIRNGIEVFHKPTNLSLKFKDFSQFDQLVFMNNTKNNLQKMVFQNTFSSKECTRKNQIYLLIIIQEDIKNESRYMYYYFQKNQNEIRLYKQKYDWCSLSFIIQDIYGNQSNNKNVKAVQEKCAICLFETVDTIFIPCRHMSICENCAKQFLKKNYQVCPICRKPYRQLIAYIPKQQ